MLILFDIGYRANLGGVLEGPPGVKVSSLIFGPIVVNGFGVLQLAHRP